MEAPGSQAGPAAQRALPITCLFHTYCWPKPNPTFVDTSSKMSPQMSQADSDVFSPQIPMLPIIVLSIIMKVKLAQSCPTLCHPMGYTVHGILQARILE